MCGIYASFNDEKFEALRLVNKVRGVKNITKKTIFMNGVGYMIGHIQSPTSNSAHSHPATLNHCDSLLWHNGIVKEKQLEEHSYMDFGGWDTHFILQIIDTYGFGALSNIDGSFACVYYSNNELFIFRNEIAPLYIDIDLNLSSLKSSDMELLPPNKVFYINDDNELIVVAEFTTKNNPYKLEG